MGGGKLGVVLLDVFGFDGEDLGMQRRGRKKRERAKRRQEG